MCEGVKTTFKKGWAKHLYKKVGPNICIKRLGQTAHFIMQHIFLYII
jgi:hypothetical protein